MRGTPGGPEETVSEKSSCFEGLIAPFNVINVATASICSILLLMFSRLSCFSCNQV